MQFAPACKGFDPYRPVNTYIGKADARRSTDCSLMPPTQRFKTEQKVALQAEPINPGGGISDE